MNLLRADQLTSRLPVQIPPISRDKQTGEAHLSQSGVDASQTACDALPSYLAQQMCYATTYGVSI
jgi:hypothetical protein